MRLVKDGKIYLDGTLRENEKEKLAFEKLEQIQDIEEEHGEFMNGIKALILGRIFIKTSKRINKRKVLSLKYKNFWALFIKSNHYVAVSDYGKTWAFTKEELKNEIH